MKKIVITTSSFAEHDKEALKLLESKGFHVELNPFARKISTKELIELASDAHGLIAGTEIIDKEAIEQLQNMEVISRCGVGMDSLDVEAIKKRGIRLFNTPDGPTQPVAELTIGLMLSLLRNVTQSDKSIRNNIWKKQMGNLLWGKKVGIIGFGRIGQKVAQLLEPFNVQIAYYDLLEIKNNKNYIKKELGVLLKWSDMISIHLSFPVDQKPILGKKELMLMKKESWIVNLSRGNVIDEQSLEELLRTRNLAGAALDVFEKEPYNGPLCALDNVILTPHIGSYAREARINMELQSAQNLIKGFDLV